MTVINGFVVVLMLVLLIYSFYRFIKKKSILMIIPISAQIFSFVIAGLCFLYNVETLQLLEACFIAMGVLPPVVFLIVDYRRMVKNIKSCGIFKGFVDRPEKIIQTERCLPPQGINEHAGEKQIQEILNDIKSLPEDIKRNIKKCLTHANILIAEANLEESFYIYETLSKVIGSSFMLYYNTAGLMLKMEKYEGSIELYRKALELSPDDKISRRDIYYNMGNAYYMLGKYENAARSYEKAIDLNKGYQKALENLAFTYVRIGEKDKGIELLSRTAVDGANYRSHLISGRLLYEAGNYEESERELKKCVKIKPYSAEAMRELGKALLKQGKNEAALSAFEKTLAVEPDNYSAVINKANIYGKTGIWDKAASSYREAIRIKPDSFIAYYNLAISLQECGSNEEAIEAFKLAIRINPDFIDAYNNLGIALSIAERHEEALEVYEEGIRRNSNEFSLFFNMGMNLFDAGKYAQAAAAYRDALEIKPDELEIYYYLGAALTELRRYNDAIDAYKSALKIKPEDGELHYGLAAIYAMLGRYDIAGDNLKCAIELKSEVRLDAMRNKAFDGMRGRSDFKEMIS